jgi:hypothetical protein
MEALIVVLVMHCGIPEAVVLDTPDNLRIAPVSVEMRAMVLEQYLKAEEGGGANGQGQRRGRHGREVQGLDVRLPIVARVLSIALALVVNGCACKPLAAVNPPRVGVSCWAAR